MTEKSTTYWNSLLEKYKEGTISAAERYDLEKRALDDPFLFDALEGFASNYDADVDIMEETQTETTIKKSGKILTLPRIAAAASIVFLLSMIVLMKQDTDKPLADDQSIAMVIAEDKVITTPTNSSEIDAGSESKIISQNTDRPTPAKKDVANQANKQDVLTDENKVENNTASTSAQKSPINTSTNEKSTRNNSPDNNGDQLKNSMKSVTGKDKTAPSTTARKSTTREVIVTHSSNKADADMSSMETADANMDEIDITESKEEVQLIDDKIFYIVEPMIGKSDFDDYVEQRIKARGLHKATPQEVVIEFTIDSEGNLSDFIHLNSTCSECGPFAISLLQTSGVWKTTPEGLAGKARYSFTF